MALGRRADELIGDPPHNADGVGRRQPEDDVPEARVDRVADRVPGGARLLVGDGEVDRADDRGWVATDFGVCSISGIASASRQTRRTSW